MSNGLKLNAEKIFEKKFPKALKGYDPYEVDLFLDQVILDYKTVENYLAKNDAYVSSLQERIDELEDANAKLTADNVRLANSNKQMEISVAGLSSRLDGIKESDKPTTENLRLIKRINTLESFLKSKGYTESQLKEFLGKE